MRSHGAAGGARRCVHAAIGALAMLVPGALAAAASAQTLTVDKPCYVNGNRPAVMTVGGTGFVPGDPVLITSSDGSVDTTATASTAGDILAQESAPTPIFTLPGAKTVTLTARDFAATGTLSATIPVTATSRAVLPQPTRAKLTSKVTWYFSGFAPGRLIYGHYLRKKQVARARFGRAHGPCGLLKVRARFYPGGHPRYSRYTLQFDNSRRYSRRSTPQVVLQIAKTLL